MLDDKNTSFGASLLPALILFTALFLAAAAVLTLLARNSSSLPAAPTQELSLIAERVPLEAQNALRGEPSAFDALDRSMGRLKALRIDMAARAAGGSSGAASAIGASEAPWRKLTDAASTVAEARAAVGTIQMSN